MVVRLPHIVKLRKSLKPSFTPSIKQRRVIRLCRSGKTATAEAIIAAHPDKRVAVITYSKRLQLKTRHQLHIYTNYKVFTFHRIASSLFRAVVLLHYNALPQWNFTPFNIILTNYFILANKQEGNGHSPQLVILGDEQQSIYRFQGTNHRYLSLAPQLLTHTSPYPFVKIPLSQSFRLSDHLVQFVNQVFLNNKSYLSSSKPSPKPIVLRYDPYNSYALAKEFALIAPSLRKNKPLQLLTNILSKKYHIPITISVNNEMYVSTIHQFKGSERHLHFSRNIPNDRCPNKAFVALTHAEKQLAIIHDKSKKLMPFISVKALYETAVVVNITNNIAKLSLPKSPSRPLKLRLSLPASISVRDIQKHINISNVILSDPRKRFYKAVSDINRLVTVAAFEHNLTLARNRIQRELGDGAANLRFKVKAEQTFRVNNHETRIQGQANIIAEIKFISHLSNSHVLQACTYTYLLGLTHIMLYNVRDGEKWEIIPHDGQEGLRHMLKSVLRIKYTTTGQMNDKEFTDMCAKVMLEVSSLDDSREQISLADCKAYHKC
ncbi:P-loop containing nucleoside triphosphate hydrolase protein [Trichoderma velutinum]